MKHNLCSRQRTFPMKKKRILIFVTLAILLGFICKDSLIRAYVFLCNDKLETYAVKMLESAEIREDNYGNWRTIIFPEDNKVEFWTGSFGLVPSSTYKGFYYSVDNSHKVFSVADASISPLEINGDYASWTDGTDNNGSSTRIIDKWFWFEASF